MSIFNSLGSNYSAGFVWRSLIKRSSETRTTQLTSSLEDYYQGQVQLTYKGRHALEIALRRIQLPSGSAVAINGFTCYVVYQAVEEAGYKPVMVDVAQGSLDFDLKQLQLAHKQNKNLRAVIVQNTLGMPVDMQALEKYCHEHDILIIEDLAHSLGTIYADGREAGMVGDLTMLSFSQDKPLDVVAGGACIDRRGHASPYETLRTMGFRQRVINRLYPFWTVLIRGTYGLGIGRVLHAGLKKFHWLATPMSDNIRGLYAMTHMGSSLLPELWDHKERILNHRRRIATVYQQHLPKAVQYQVDAGNAAYLRFPIHVTNRAGMVAYLKRSHIYVGDTWYDAPIAPMRYLSRTDYRSGQCPQAERLATEIVNLPTHRHVSEAQARQIAEKVNQWLQST